MGEILAQNWILLVVALVLAILALWWVLTSSSRNRVEIEREDPAPDAPARRNQALIDTPPAAPLRDLPVAPAVPVTPVVPDAAVPLAEEPATEAPLAETPVAETVVQPEIAAAPSQPAPAEIPAQAPAPVAPPQPVPAPKGAAAAGDDLTRIKGLGPKLAAQLNQMGVTGFAQIAAWDDGDIDRIDADLGRFKGRIRRDNWVEQARFLAADDLSGYETRFGKL